MPLLRGPYFRSNLGTLVRGVGQLPVMISSWRGRRRASPAWTVATALILAMVALPVVTIALIGLKGGDGTWSHLASTVLPASLRDTAILLVGVGTLTLIIGTGTAWLVTMYRFPGRGLLDRLLVIPLAMPTCLVAYCYVDLLDFDGPPQALLRWLTGYTARRDYWFPDVRSMTGAILMLSSVLYPYVYLTARASFVQQSVCALEVARTLGRTPLGAFWSVALPLARPALAGGVALVLMECLNDIGAVQHLGIPTLAAAIQDTWQQRSSLAGAAQIAIVMLILVAILFAIESAVRSGGSVVQTTGRYRSLPFADLEGWRAVGATIACLLPFIAGFVLPALVLLANAWRHWSPLYDSAFWIAAMHSFFLAGLAAMAAVLLAVVISYSRRVAANGFTRPAARLAGLGYALPGTVLALGLLVALATLDTAIHAFAKSTLGITTGLILSGSVAALVVAYAIRFLAVSLSAIDSGLARISPNLDAAARTLGETAL
ncbi:MAG TPA: iron ABC transporter permease, partial [Hyphomicrobiaceae bacterium]|nr:iron ABC transporter permease [Hyphomicrobiaceae bacterium]